eukprot:7262780-Karenia_brevis.AAC.1
MYVGTATDGTLLSALLLQSERQQAMEVTEETAQCPLFVVDTQLTTAERVVYTRKPVSVSLDRELLWGEDKFWLRAVLVYHGNASYGHWRCYIVDAVSMLWLEYDDGVCRHHETMPADAATHSRAAVYMRARTAGPAPTKPHVSESAMSAASSGDVSVTQQSPRSGLIIHT